MDTSVESSSADTGEVSTADVSSSTSMSGEPSLGSVSGGSGWRSLIAEDKRSSYEGMSDDDALSALERGRDYVPLKEGDSFSFEKTVELPDYVDADLRNFAIENGLTEKQAAAAYKFYESQGIKSSEEVHQSNLESLKKSWNNDFDKNIGFANKAFNYFESKLGGIASSLDRNSDPIIRILSEIGKGLTEPDSSGHGTANQKEEIPTEDYYRQYHKN